MTMYKITVKSTSSGYQALARTKLSARQAIMQAFCRNRLLLAWHLQPLMQISSFELIRISIHAFVCSSHSTLQLAFGISRRTSAAVARRWACHVTLLWQPIVRKLVYHHDLRVFHPTNVESSMRRLLDLHLVDFAFKPLQDLAVVLLGEFFCQRWPNVQLFVWNIEDCHFLHHLVFVAIDLWPCILIWHLWLRLIALGCLARQGLGWLCCVCLRKMIDRIWRFIAISKSKCSLFLYLSVPHINLYMHKSSYLFISISTQIRNLMVLCVLIAIWHIYLFARFTDITVFIYACLFWWYIYNYIVMSTCVLHVMFPVSVPLLSLHYFMVIIYGSVDLICQEFQFSVRFNNLCPAT